MKLRLLSDLHLEFAPWEIPKLEGDKDTTLLLAGDIGVGVKEHTWKPFLEQASEQFKYVIYTPGNHEYYHGSYADVWEDMIINGLGWENVFMLNQEQYTLDGVRFMCATLWTRLNPQEQVIAKYAMNDYRLVKRTKKGSSLHPSTTVLEHEDTLSWMEAQFKVKHSPTVVMTHHGPSYQSIHKEFEGDPLNAAYVTNLEDKILEWEPELWVHGHVHNSFSYQVGNTKIVTNPKGYPMGMGDVENPNFNPKLTIEIELSDISEV